MEATHLNQDNSAISNPSTDRRTSQRTRKLTQFFAQDAFNSKGLFDDLKVEFKVSQSSGIEPLLTQCSFKTHSACPLSHLKRKLSKAIGLNQNRAKLAYYDTLSQRNLYSGWKKVKSFSHLSTLKNVKVRLFYPKSKKSAEKVAQATVSNAKTVYMDPMAYISYDLYSNWYMNPFMVFYSPYVYSYPTACNELKSVKDQNGRGY